MSFPALSAALATAARSAGATSSADVSDGELLRAYARTRAEAPFDELVRRLGPLVLGVCRRVAGDRHLADDAFQAAFVVLARRAGDVHPAEAVRAWLYGVAVRTAREARAVSARRLAREVPMSAIPDRAQKPARVRDADALAALDEEIAGLPEHLRAAVVLCELEGVSRKDAAGRLGIVEGTLSSRLGKARKLLARQLRKRGVSLPAAGLAVLAHVAVSPRLAAQTSALVSPAAPLPPAVAALSHGVLRTMFVHKLILYVGCFLILAAARLALSFALPDAAAKDPPRPPARPVFIAASAIPAPPPDAKPTGAGSIVVARHVGAYWVLAPDGKKHADVEVPEMTRPTGGAAISPDGKRVAYVVNTEVAPRPVPKDVDEIQPWPFKIIVRPLDRPDGAKEFEMSANHLSLTWTADGKRLIASKVTNPRWTEYECLLLDPETGQTEKFNPNGRVLDAAKDGKTFLVQGYDTAAKKCELTIARDRGRNLTVLGDLLDFGNRPTEARLSPDGTRILLIDADPARKDAHKWGCSQRVYLINVATKKREPLPDFPENGRAWGVAWSPDGKKIAYSWTPLNDEVLKKDTIGAEDARQEVEGFLVVADANGKNAKTIATDKGMFVLGMVLGAIDWR